MKLVLYNPRSNGSGKRILPLSLLALGAVLEGRHEYTIVDGNAERDPLAALESNLIVRVVTQVEQFDGERGFGNAEYSLTRARHRLKGHLGIHSEGRAE